MRLSTHFAAICCAVSGLFFHASCNAQSALLNTFPPTLMLLSDPSGSPYGKTGWCSQTTSPTWAIGQWGIPSALPASCYTNNGGASTNWQTANLYARVKYYVSTGGRSKVYELAQSGTCTGERNLFLVTAAGSPSQPGTSRGMTPSSPLNQIGSINIGAGLQITWSNLPGTACFVGCGVDQFGNQRECPNFCV